MTNDRMTETSQGSSLRHLDIRILLVIRISTFVIWTGGALCHRTGDRPRDFPGNRVPRGSPHWPFSFWGDLARFWTFPPNSLPYLASSNGVDPRMTRLPNLVRLLSRLLPGLAIVWLLAGTPLLASEADLAIPDLH